MALIVDDGTGLATAEAYISVTDADAYFSRVRQHRVGRIDHQGEGSRAAAGCGLPEGYRWKGDRLTARRRWHGRARAWWSMA